MTVFSYKNTQLMAENVSLTQLAQSMGTPLYCYSTKAITDQFLTLNHALEGLDTRLCFALKANSNLSIIRTLADLGAGADVVSEGELRRALEAKISPQKIVFSGVGKTVAELTLALTLNIYQINVESEAELMTLNSLALSLGKKAPIALRINPDIDANTHHKISTGRSDDKFGIEWDRAYDVLLMAQTLPGLTLQGIAIHIGSQITQLKPFEEAFKKIKELLLRLKQKGLSFSSLDLGGGLAIPYQRDQIISFDCSDYADLVRHYFRDLNYSLIFEPGRFLVGNAGLLVSRVLYIKEGSARHFVICDAGMNDLMRPALYDSWHDIMPLEEPSRDTELRPYDVVGPICESSDIFCKDRPLPILKAGDYIAFMSAGAYGSSMSSTYNSRLLIPEILVHHHDYAVVRTRPTYQELFNLEKIAPWMTD